MKKYKLTAQKRDSFGRKVRKLRQMGMLPATVYGKKLKSVSVQVKSDEFAKIYQEAGETGLVELALDKEVRPVLIHHVQTDPVENHPLHVEFFQVDLKEKVKTKVPLVFVGESPAVTQKQGVILTLLDEIEVEALPTNLPEKIEVDVSNLATVDQELKVADLKVPEGVVVLTETSLTVVKVGALVSKEAEAEAAAEAAAAAAAAVEGEAKPAEGEASKEETAKEAPQAEAKPASSTAKPQESSKS